MIQSSGTSAVMAIFITCCEGPRCPVVLAGGVLQWAAAVFGRHHDGAVVQHLPLLPFSRHIILAVMFRLFMFCTI